VVFLYELEFAYLLRYIWISLTLSLLRWHWSGLSSRHTYTVCVTVLSNMLMNTSLRWGLSRRRKWPSPLLGL